MTILTSQIFININGTAVPRGVMAQLAEVMVDQHVHLPDMFTIKLHDTSLKLLDEGPFDLAKEIEIQAESKTGSKVTLIKGEITALEPQFQEGMTAVLVVRGYDKSHRLYRQTKTAAYLNKKDSDLANEIAQQLGLSAEVDTTSTVYDHIFQNNQSDLSFLMQRAWRIGYECFVIDSKLHFRKPPNNGSGITLIWGQDLLSFMPRMTVAEQVNEVLVKGWDADQMEPIVGQASSGRLYAGVQESKDGKAWGQQFGTGKKVIVDQPVISQAEADVLAQARLDEISGAFVEAEGEAHRKPEIRAGQMVSLDGLGERFSGTYLVTAVTHYYTPAGLKSHFTVRGARTGTMAELTTHQPPQQKIPGAVIAIVTNTDDPNNWGRVKVKYPWLADDAESSWARVVTGAAGPEAGLAFIPEVGDEVAVLFEQGDFNRPLVLGGMWNGQHNLPPATANAGSGEKPSVQSWTSRTGHTLAMYDTADNKVEIVTAGGHKFLLDDANAKIEIVSSGGMKIVVDDNGRKLTFEGTGDVQINSATNMTIEAGANLALKATGNLDVEANGMVNIKGAMVKLN
ncbi:MAG: VgrG-related protein [Candidatus Promineifilaceae bacterium]